MAILTDANYGSLRDATYQRGRGKEELKALVTLPNKPKLRAAFQAIEDNDILAWKKFADENDMPLS